MSAAGQLPKYDATLVAVRHSGDITVREVRPLPAIRCTACQSTRVVRDDRHADLYCDDCGLILADPGCSPSFELPFGHTVQSLVKGKPVPSHIGIPHGAEAMKFGKGMMRLRLVQNRATRDVRKGKAILDEIGRICFELGLPEVIAEEGRANYLEARRRGAARGFLAVVTCAAVVLHTARNRGIAIPIRKACTALNLPKTASSGIFRVLRLMHRVGMRDRLPTAEDYVGRFLVTLELPGIFHAKCQEFLREYTDRSAGISSSPSVLAATAIYCVLQNADREKHNGTVWARTQMQLAELAGCTEVSLRNVKHHTEKIGWSPDHGWGPVPGASS